MPTLRSLTRPLLGAALALAASTAALAQAAPAEAPRWSFAIHGGAGVIERASLSPEQDAAYRAALTRALEAGGGVLARGGTSLDAIQAAIEIMEDDPLFNAGRGAVFTAAGRNELDAAVMNGSDLSAGAVAGLTTTRHPIAAARAVMERSPHVMLIGQGADGFAASTGLEQVPPSYFYTQRRWDGLVKFLTEAGRPIPLPPAGTPQSPFGGMADNDASAPPLNEKKFGTVGAVALDLQGNLAAGTSTGGTTGKRWGRVGDVPVIGAGTYASNRDGCAVSATGDGEYFIRATVARDICARIGADLRMSEAEREFWDNAISEACDAKIAPGELCIIDSVRSAFAAAEAEVDEAKALGGSGGVIVMPLDGRPAFAMSTSGMYRGEISSDAPQPRVAIYADEAPR